MGYGVNVGVDAITITKNSAGNAQTGAGFGTHAARPAAGTAARVYYETDTNTYFYDSGSAWVTFAASAVANTFTQLITFQVGLALNPAIADSSTAGKFFLSSTTANMLKYYDTQATPVLHTLTTLEDAQTFTAAKTFPASGIKLAGSSSGLTTFLSANASVTNYTLTFPAATDTLAAIGIANSWTATQDFQQIEPHADNTYSDGTSALRWASVNSVAFNVYHASGDANPSAQLGDGFLKLGAGGASALDIALSYNLVAVHEIGFRPLAAEALTVDISGNGANPIELRLASTDITSANFETLVFRPDTFANAWEIGSRVAGTGSLRALVFAEAGTESFRMTTDPVTIFSKALQIAGGTTSTTANQIWNASQGAASTPLFIGNAQIATSALNKRLTADVTSINGTTSSGLTVALAANTNYIFRAYISYYVGASTPGINWQIHALAAGAALVVVTGTTGLVGQLAATSNMDEYGHATAVTTSIFPNSNNGTTTVYYNVQLYGTITVGANATTLQIDLVDTVATDTVKAGSFIMVDPVA